MSVLMGSAALLKEHRRFEPPVGMIGSVQGAFLSDMEILHRRVPFFIALSGKSEFI